LGTAVLETPFHETASALETEFPGVRSQTEFGNED
jgi:hypothetical protein